MEAERRRKEEEERKLREEEENKKKRAEMEARRKVGQGMYSLIYTLIIDSKIHNLLCTQSHSS